MRFLVSSICVLLICQLTFVRAGSSMDSSLADNMTITLTPVCNVTCTNFAAIDNNCNSPHCGCNTEYIEAQGNCLLCFSTTPEDDAAVQFLLDAEAAQCQREGHSVSFSLDLPPLAEALVQTFNRQSADLRRNQVVFLTLQILGGHIGLPASQTDGAELGEALQLSSFRRDSTFLNFCVTWIFSSIAFSLLLYRGTTGNTIINLLGEVEPDICIAQAALTVGAQLMTACSTLSLNIRLWLGLRAVIHGDEVCSLKGSVRRWTTVGLLVTPYLFFATFSLGSLSVGLPQIEGSFLKGANPSYFNCTIFTAKPLAGVTYGIALVLVLASVGFGAHVISILYRHWWTCWHTKTKSAISPIFLIRVVFFSIFQIIVAVADGTVIGILPKINNLPTGYTLITNGVPQWIDMLGATAPLVAALIFGITNDMIMRVMSFIIFWRRNVSANDEGLRVISIYKDGYTTNTAPAEGDSSTK